METLSSLKNLPRPVLFMAAAACNRPGTETACHRHISCLPPMFNILALPASSCVALLKEPNGKHRGSLRKSCPSPLFPRGSLFKCSLRILRAKQAFSTSSSRPMI